MQLSLVYPMFWGRKKKKIYKQGDHFYEHPTALDDEDTIPPLFESMRVLKDRDFDIIAVVGANHPSKEKQVEKAAKKLIFLAASDDVKGITGKYFVKNKITKTSDLTMDKTLQKELWDLSIDLIKIKNGKFS